jgi:hypothetical protein
MCKEEIVSAKKKRKVSVLHSPYPEEVHTLPLILGIGRVEQARYK